MIEAMQHSCSIARSTVDKRLNFDAGSAVFTVAKTLTGATSHATGTVKTVTKSTGEWAAGTAAGYLILSNVTGVFADNEPIADNGTVPGAALANGASGYNGDDYGIPSAVTATTTVKCRFVNPKGGMKKLESGEHIYNLPAAVLPSGTTIAEVDLLTGVTYGFTQAVRVKHVRTVQADEGISHIRCDLEAVT
jgi:hypothetical protein